MKKLALLVIGSALIGSASASVTLNLGTNINGSVAGAGSPSWLTAQFETLSTGTVQLTMTNNMTTASGGFVTSWLFNSNKAITGFSHLTSPVNGPVATGASYASNGNSGANDIKGGLYDVLFTFTNSNNANRFSGQKSTIYTLTGTGLTENDFLSTSIAGGSNNPGSGYYTAAKIQGYGLSAGVGTKVEAVPEPASLTALALGGIAVLRRRKKA
jgi:hypothetical protein